jgi:hypothetical protein
MERGRIPRDHDQIDGGVPTPGARRAGVATASASLLLAVAVAVYAAATGPQVVEALAAFGGVALVLVALVAVWDDALTYGAMLLVAGYALSLPDNDAGVDLVSPLVAVALLGAVEFGAWSLELREGAEERPLARLPAVSLLLVGGMAASSLILAVGGVRLEGGLVFWVFGAAAALALLALVSRVRDTQPK